MSEAAATLLASLDPIALVIEGIGPEAYTRTAPPVAPSSIGAHIRHLLDHLAAFCRFRTDAGLIDYVNRERDPALESSPTIALAFLREARTLIEGLSKEFIWEETACLVRVSVEPAATPTPSNLAREAAFLVSHNLHHLALVAITGRVLGLVLPTELGIAPSTLAHRRSVGRAS